MMKKIFLLAFMFCVLFGLSGIVPTASADRGGFGHAGAPSNAPAQSSTHIMYTAHVSHDGWQSEVRDGEVAGTTGQSKSIEALIINTSKPIGLRYRVYCEGLGWSAWLNPGEMAGTTGESRPIKGIELSSKHGRLMYQVHVANNGWLDWCSEKQVAGGLQNNIEAIRIVERDHRGGSNHGEHGGYREHRRW